MPGPPRPGISSSPISPRHPPTQPFPWVGPSNAPFGSEKRPFFRTHPSPVLRPSMPGAVFLEGAVVRTVLVILLYDFLLRVQSNLAVFDLTLLRFFKSKISGPRKVWGIRSPGNLVRLGPQSIEDKWHEKRPPISGLFSCLGRD